MGWNKDEKAATRDGKEPDLGSKDEWYSFKDLPQWNWINEFLSKSQYGDFGSPYEDDDEYDTLGWGNYCCRVS